MRSVWITLFILTGISLHAQNEDDALRYSQLYFGGSARNMSTAGAFGAVGGDYSVVSSNPAGLARFKKHNFSVSTVIEAPVVKTNYYGNYTNNTDAAFKISNISYLKAYNLDPATYKNWYGIQMGAGYNRINSFHETINYGGEVDSSILHSFIKMANGTSTDLIYSAFPFDAGLAYDTYALDPGPNNTYVTDFTQGKAIQNRTINRKGGMGEYTFTLSGNYMNKLFLGGAFNLTRVKYEDNYEHREVYTDSSLWIQSIRYLYSLDIDGWGYGARVGAIFLPVDWIRIGASVQTPTFFRLNDFWTANMSTMTDEGLKYVASGNVPTGSFSYNVMTPLRGNLSLGIIFKKLGSIGLDAEFVDYGSASLASRKFSDGSYSFISENSQIDNIYRSVVNTKIGAEIRVNSQIYLRAGYANFASPFKPGKGNALFATHVLTTGVGYNFGKLYLDGALLWKNSVRDYYGYDPTINGSYAKVISNQIMINFSFGVRFE